MRIRFSTFIGVREVSKVEGGYTTRIDFELPHRVMLCDLKKQEVLDLYKQCADKLKSNSREPIFLGSVTSIEEVSNQLQEDINE